jgi:predicted transposase YbfD/YdcC
MTQKPIPPIMDFFKNIEDPRIDRNKAYPLIEVLVITILAVICSAEGWEDIEEYGEAKEPWLRKFLPLEHGIPRHDVYRRVMSRLKPEQVESCFMDWVRAIKQDVNREIIAIDGKTVRGSFNTREGQKAIHLVSAWATENRLVFAQKKVDEKQNEITVIPELLEMIALKGCIVTSDAMGCQYKIANQTVGSGADYLFSLKENQETLYEDVKEYFQDLDFSHPPVGIQVTEGVDVDHGRIERRKAGITDEVGWLWERHPAWESIKSIGVIESRRDVGEKVSVERRYYISSLPADAKLFALAVRAHWGIENSLHYVLDVAFREDACRIKSGNAPENMAFIRKMALTLARSDTGATISVRKRVKKLSWSDTYFEECLFHSVFGSPKTSSPAST